MQSSDEWLILARRAGLDRAIEDYPTDVQAAAAAAKAAIALLTPPTDPAHEPWPAMCVVPAA